ncbi:UDP-2,4-diacetamido-2,4,6-trideoxy-beta-L-altropyranose hydrolase [Vreelandella alkaliphila]|uniref:UDP-2,4-diacetamido-2,4, 6-trideoxy-beta-L-altropyranose hydrolase n=1 Tax=Vreelandella alkaliphila TaxID=272774 RepID=UPI00232D2BC9|nr:UDP-2,4-diacetamido-2,4,6-trideoxy-beta-L-altropyranose hydrolase [Halomonas alkaliphila]
MLNGCSKRGRQRNKRVMRVRKRSKAPVSQQIAFRVDASVQIGTGHVMRCLTLANALHEFGAECHFLCREHEGHLVEYIEAQGFQVYRLNPASPMEIKSLVSTQDTPLPYHVQWLEVPWQVDAFACRPILELIAPDWLVVDHYALDARWEGAACPINTRLLVIDDLADREHLADMLLDQNLGRKKGDYTDLTPTHCRKLIGPKVALLRPEFAQWRVANLARCLQKPKVTRLLITLGGVDKDNVTGQVLEALNDCSLPEKCEITVIMGATAPWLDDVKIKANALSWPTEVVVNVNNMAQRMAEADLAIGAAGSTSWERCCMGLPTLMLVLAENQRDIAHALHKAGAAVCLGNANSSSWQFLLHQLIAKITMDSSYRNDIASKAAEVTNGEGVSFLVGLMMKDNHEYNPFVHQC